jgi:hypothetical protein
MSAEKFIEQGNAIDVSVGNYLSEVIRCKQHPEQAYKSCQGILALQRKAGSERLINACRRAGDFQFFSYSAVLNILEKGLDKMKEEPQQTSLQLTHHNIRGNEYYK